MNKRTTILYGNCKVYSPNNKLMFRCEEKRAKWYLDRNLAKIIEQDPISIQLTFQPKGEGDKLENLKEERKNICVVCGELELSVLTKHHIVPYEYRKYMTNDIKQHSSMFVVPICSNCHKIYEVDFSSKLKEKLSKEYKTEFYNKIDLNLSGTISKINCLLKHYNKLPLNVREEMQTFSLNYITSNKIAESVNFLDTNELKEILLKLKEKQTDNAKSHGRLVIERCQDFSAFERAWINDFVNNMNPKHLPGFIKEYINNQKMP